MKIKSFIKAARLRTLPLSVSGIIVGAFLGVDKDSGVTTLLFSDIFWLAIFTTIGFQILSNFANDYGDGIKGTDNNRKGEKRLVASGDVSPNQMKNAIYITGILSFIFALFLIYVSFGKENFIYSVIFFVLGVFSIVAAIKYTVGKTAYGYSGFGDVFVFLFFGLLAVVGTYFLYVHKLYITIFLPACSVGLLSTAVLNLNNMRDRENDSVVGKNTLVVKMGAIKAKYYHYSLILLSLLFAIVYVCLNYRKPIQFLFLIAYIPLIKHLFFVKKNSIEEIFDGELKKVALSTFLFSLLFGLGQIF